MDTFADYETWKAKQQQNNVGAANVVLSATNGKPDEIASDLNLASEFGKTTGNPVPPLPLVQEHRSVFQAEIARQKNSTILGSSPRLTEWLRNPENAAVAKDDLSGLSWWETPLAAAKNAVSRGVQRMPMTYNQLMANAATQRLQDQGKSFGDILSSETDVRDENGKLLYQGLPGPIDLFKAGSRFATSRFSEFLGPDAAKSTAAYYQQQVGLINKRIAEIPMSPAAEQGRKNWTDVHPTGHVLTDLGAYMQAIGKDPKAFAAFAAETAAESLPNMAAATAVTIGTGNPVAGAVALGASSAATEMGTAPADVFKENGLDISTPEGALAAISDPELMRAAIKRGNVRGLIVGMMDGLSGGVAGKMLAESHLGNMVLQSLTQAAMGAAGEAGGQYFSGQQMSLGDILMEGLAEFATAPVEVVGVGGRAFMENSAKAKAADARKALFEALSGQAQASALRKRMPDKFREFVAEATKDGPVENVFVPADKFTEYFQSIGVDPHELVDSLEGVTRDDLDAALAGGGDLQIPTATYAAHIAGSEHDAFLMENMRFDPDEFTSAEAAEFNARANDALEEAWQVAEQLRQQDEEMRSFEQEIYDTMVSRLREAGRSTDVATTEALLYPAFYRVMAERSGMTTEEFMQQYPLPGVRGALPEGMQLRDVDALTRTLAEARSTKTLRDKRQTLLEFIADYGGINDAGGELAARDATVVNRGKGKKSLRLARKGFVAGMKSMLPSDGGKQFGADDVALAAIKRGFMADSPTVSEYLRARDEGRQTPDLTAALWDAIDAELAGTPQHSSQDAIDPAIERAAELGDLEKYLSEVGVSLNDDDATIRKALEKAGSASFEQFAGISAKTLERDALFKAAELRANGATRDEIYDETGFFVGPDGMWRFEISDADARIKANALNDTFVKSVKRYDGMLGGLLDHSKLFEAYPIIKTIHVTFVVNPRAVEEGSWNGDAIAVSAKTVEEARSILLHEISHVVQDEEGFASGGNPSMGELYEGPTVDLYKLEAERLLKEWDRVEARIKTTTSTEERARLDALLKELGASMSATHAAIIKAARMEYYKRLAGEVEARNVQKRDQMQRGEDEAQRFWAQALGQPAEKGTIDAPWWTQDVPPSKVIVVRTHDRRRAFEALSGPDTDSIFLQGTEKGARGLIQFPAEGVGNGETIIRLFETANLSTVVHESGHYFLTVMQDLAARGEVQAAADVKAVRDWWRENASDVAKDAARSTDGLAVTADDVTTWLDIGTTGDAVKDRAIVVGGQEQFARGFEAYLMEGRAPNAELRSAFEKFRAWLVSIYQRLTGLNVNMSDNIRRVFDRMIATDQEIAKAEAGVGGSSPVLATAEQLGLTADEYARLMKLRQQSEDSAKSRLLREIMEPIKREKEKWFKEERAKVKKQVETQINAYPSYRAIEWMGNKRWLGEGQTEDMPDMRLSKDILVARYGAGVLKTLPRGKQTIYTVEGGIDPDEAAGWFGFDSGDQMIQAMERAPKRAEAIDAETDRIMRDRHGDVLNDGSLEAEAMDAVHVDKRGQWIAAELKAVSEVAGLDYTLTAKEAKASARQTIARMRVRDAIASNRFLAAERKAAEEAARIGAQLARNGVWLNAANRRVEAKARAAAKGKASPDALAKEIEQRNAKLESRDTTVVRTGRGFGADGGQFVTATEGTAHTAGYNELVSKMIDAKRRQLLNHALYMESRKVADEVEKAESYVQRLNKKATRERIAGAGRRENATIDYLGAIDEILERYDFRKISGAAEQRRGSLNAFIEAMKAAGRENELAIPESVLIDAARKPYKTLPVEQLRGVIDSLKNLEHVATRWDKLIDAQNERALDEVVNDIAEAFEANVRKRPPGRVKTKAEGVRHAARQFLDLVLNATTLLREIDGYKDDGAAHRNIKAPIDAAMSRLIVRKEDAAAALEKLYSVYSKAERREMAVRRHMPQIGFALSKWERIAVALNTGNEGNMQRLTDPKVRGSFTEAQVAGILASLDERDADFVQSVWDYVGSFRNDIAAREKRTTGIEPKWVEASPVTIAGKVLTGGYYPIKYDPRLSSLARDDQTQEIAQSLQAGRFGKAQTRNGHLKERAQSSGRDVELDMSVLHRHVNQVIYDLELSEAVANSWRILQDGRIRDAFTEAGKQADFDALELWLKDVAEGELRSGDFVGRAARTLKSNFTAAKLAFNLVTVASQVTGLAQTMVVIGKRDFVRGLQASFRPGAIDDITAKSAFMSTRATTFNKDIHDFYNDPKMGPVASRWGDIKSEWIGPLSFWLMTKVQWYTVDIPSWLAGYKQGLRRFGNDEAKAIAHADDIVKRAQASGLFSDRSAIERGSVSRTARQNDVVRLFTALGSYMFAKFNVAYERTGKASRTVRQEGASARSAAEVMSWTVDMAFLFTFEAVVMAAIRGQLPGGDDDDKDEGWGTFLAKQTGLSVLGTIPFIRDGVSALQGFDGGGAYGGMMGDAAKGATGMWNILTAPLKEEGLAGIKPSDIKGIINATGLVTGAPSTQINRGVDALLRSREGEDVSPLEYILGRRAR